MDLITKKYFEDDDLDETYVNDLTKNMDLYLVDNKKDIYDNLEWYTYIYSNHKINNSYAIRFPGATRGHIEVSPDNIITKIVLYKNYGTHKIYKENVEDCFKQYIGMKLVFK